MTRKAKSKEPVAKNAAKVISLADVKKGSLVSEIRDEKVTFYHNGEEFEIEVRVKQLPFIETERLHTKLADGEDVAAEWISKALVDDNGDQLMTQEEVENNFIQPLATAVFNLVYGLEGIKKALAKVEKKAE